VRANAKDTMAARPRPGRSARISGEEVVQLRQTAAASKLVRGFGARSGSKDPRMRSKASAIGGGTLIRAATPRFYAALAALRAAKLNIEAADRRPPRAQCVGRGHARERASAFWGACGWNGVLPTRRPTTPGLQVLKASTFGRRLASEWPIGAERLAARAK